MFQERGREGASRVCDLLSPSLDLRIEISRDRRGIPNLLYEFENVEGVFYQLDCHLHTKFKGYWEFEGRQDHGDRIYFRWPEENFHDGKVLVARIGGHA